MTELATILDTHFAGGTPPTTLYVGFVSSTNFIGFNKGVDTMAAHTGWEEFTDYAEASRPTWTPGTVIDTIPAKVTNPSQAEVTPTADGICNGVFLCDDDAPGGTTGTLYGPWPLSEGPQPFVTGEAFRAEVPVTLDYRN